MNARAEMFTKNDMDIALLKQKNDDFNQSLLRIEGHQRWMMGIMGSGFIGLLGLLAHGFHWL